jgi:hypothetical protein
LSRELILEVLLVLLPLRIEKAFLLLKERVGRVLVEQLRAGVEVGGVVALAPTSFASVCAVGTREAPAFSVPLTIDCTVGLNVVVWL